MEWLHFCDFHIGGPRGPQTEALRSLLENVRILCERRGNNFDAIVLAGDLAYSGQPDEYARFAEVFLGPLREIPGLTKSTVFAVPGNHDVDCDRALPITWVSIQKRNQDIFFGEDKDGTKIRATRASVFEAYWDFVKKNNIVSPNPFAQVSLLHSDSRLPFDIVATNTAFFSDKSENSSKPATPVPLASLRAVVSSRNQKRPVIVIAHHSPSTFIPEHERQLTSFLIDNKAVMLHGHEHNPKATFKYDGTLRTLGFGATYLASLDTAAESPYVNSFAHCRVDGIALQLNSFSWQHTAGRWIDNTETQFSECRCGNTQYRGYASIQLPVAAGSVPTGQVVLASVPREKARISRIIPIAAPDMEMWKRLMLISDNFNTVFRPEGFTIRESGHDDEKLTFVVESEGKRDLVVFIGGVNHVLSSKEIESFNTTLDTENYASVTVLSLGKITDDAYGMYVRLKTRKPIEVLVNKHLTADAERMLSQEQVAVMSKLDTARHNVCVLAGDKETYLLVVETNEKESSFFVVDGKGQTLAASDTLVSALREGQPEFKIMRYAGDNETVKGHNDAPFDAAKYLSACYKHYNVIKYAALANVGIRFSDLPLDELYVNATATETDDAPNNRLQAVVEDYLASFPLSDALKKHVQSQLLDAVDDDNRQESSQAREFCQKYSGVLITGDPGSGKTCFVKSEILAYCKHAGEKSRAQGKGTESWYSHHVPVMVQLSEVVAETDLDSVGMFVIAARLLARRGFAFPASEIEALAKQGQIAWFFDGLDEVVSVERRAGIVQCINDLVTKFLPLGNRVIVTSRPAAVHVVNLLPTLRKLEIQGLSESEIATLARRILRMKLSEGKEGIVVDEGGAAKEHEALVHQLVCDCKSNPGVARLAQNPLLLTLLIMIYANSGAPSAKRHRIYEEAIQTLASVRGREAGHSPISAQDLRERLGAVALSVYKKDSGLLPSRKEVCEIVQDVMSRQRDEKAKFADAKSFIQKVAESTGLIVVQNREGEQDDNAIVTFMHHSFLEYFAAIGLSRNLETIDIENLVTQPRWREILTLLSGIIGENADVAPIIARFLECNAKEHDVDARLILFAMDCALECEVPSDAAQRLVGKAIKHCLSKGPGQIDPWVRSEIGVRLARLFAVCGGGEFEPVLLEMMSDESPRICAAAIQLFAVACRDGYESRALVHAFDRACERTDEPIVCAVCEAASMVQLLRTEAALKVIARSLNKSPRMQRAALQALANVPSLALQNWSEIINGIDSKDSRTSRLASLAALHAGLNADLITLTGTKKDILVRALRCVDELGPDDHIPKVRSETLERMLASPTLRDRLIAIQLLPMADAGEQYIYNRLTDVLNAKTDREEVVAALVAFRSNSTATALFTQGDLRTIADLAVGGTSDVRVAAVKLLGCFPTEVLAVETLLAAKLHDLTTDEYVARVHALSFSTVVVEKVTSLLFEELSYFLNENRNLGPDNVKRLKSVLSALTRLGKPASGKVAAMVRDLVEDYRVDVEVRQKALLCFPAIAIPTQNTVSKITSWIASPPPKLDRELAQVASIVAKQCRQSVDYVIACITALTDFRTTLIGFHQKLMVREISDAAEHNISELRTGINEVTQIIVAFNEFIENGKSAIQGEMSLESTVAK